MAAKKTAAKAAPKKVAPKKAAPALSAEFTKSGIINIRDARQRLVKRYPKSAFRDAGAIKSDARAKAALAAWRAHVAAGGSSFALRQSRAAA